WPDGNRPLRTSSSVMVGFLDAARECGEVLAIHVPDSLGIFDTKDPPHRNGVVARAKLLLTLGKGLMLRLHCSEIEGRHMGDERFGGGAESFHGILRKSIRPTDQPTILPAIGPPDQRLVFGVELLDTLVRFDHFRTGHSNPSLFGYNDPRTGRGSQTSAAECTCLAADQRDDCYTRAASLDAGTH